MNLLLILFLLVDILAALFLFRQAFVERSNMNRKYRRRFVAMVVVIIGALVAWPFNLLVGCILAGLPAVALLLFGIGMAVALATHRGPWN